MTTHGMPGLPWHTSEAAALPEAEALLLDAMRAWAAAATPLPAAAMVLAAAGAEALAVPLDMLLRRAAPTSRCTLCPEIGAEEMAMLMALALAQHGEKSCALAMLLRVAPPLAAYQSMGAVLTLAGGLRALGIGLARPFTRGG